MHIANRTGRQEGEEIKDTSEGVGEAAGLVGAASPTLIGAAPAGPTAVPEGAIPIAVGAEALIELAVANFPLDCEILLSSFFFSSL